MRMRIVILSGLFLISVLFWSSVSFWIDDPQQEITVTLWSIPLIALVLLSSVLCLSFILFRDRPYKFISSFLIIAGYLASFGWPSHSIVGFFLLLLMFHYRSMRIAREERITRIKINIAQILRRSLPSILTPIFIIISFTYFLTPYVQESATRDQLPVSVRRIINFSIDNFIAPEVKNLPLEQQEGVRELIIDRLTDLAQPYFRFTPLLFALGLFLILQGFRFILVWLSMLAGFTIFKGLVRLNVIKVDIVQVNAEVLKLF